MLLLMMEVMLMIKNFTLRIFLSFWHLMMHISHSERFWNFSYSSESCLEPRDRRWEGGSSSISKDNFPELKLEFDAHVSLQKSHFIHNIYKHNYCHEMSRLCFLNDCIHMQIANIYTYRKCGLVSLKKYIDWKNKRGDRWKKKDGMQTPQSKQVYC